MSKLPKFSSNKAPAIADAMNELSQAIEKRLESYAIHAGSGVSITQSEGGQTVSVRRNTAEDSTTQEEELYPFSPYTPEYKSTSPTPSDWGLKYNLVPGHISGVWAENIMEELDAFPNVTAANMRFVCLEITPNQLGYVSSAMIVDKSSLPVNKEPSVGGTLPTKFTVVLFAYTSSATAITKVYRFVKSNLNLSVSTTYPSCSDMVRSIFVTTA